MRALSSAELLRVWERGLGYQPLERALVVLSTTGEDDVDPATLTMGERDARLLTLREQTFGAGLTAIAVCPQCGEEIELSCHTNDLRTPPGSGEPLSLSDGGIDVEFRLPTSNDVRAATVVADRDEFDVLLARCIVRATRDGQSLDPLALPPAIVARVVEQMGAADSQAEIMFDVSCEACGHRWDAPFDIESFFWTELQAWAARLLAEVHQLAAAYGWSEEAILGMSATRRHLYLNLLAE